MRNDTLTLMQILTTSARQEIQGAPAEAAGWAPSAVWLLLRQNARASRSGSRRPGPEPAAYDAPPATRYGAGVRGEWPGRRMTRLSRSQRRDESKNIERAKRCRARPAFAPATDP
jgi:hypothetical protein